MNDLGGYIATIVVGLVLGYLGRFLEPRSRLLGWSPHNFLFHLKNENVLLQANSLTVKNVGRKAAEQIEIVHANRPDFFQLWPAVGFSEFTNPNGEHVIKIDSLGPRDWFFLQLLSYRTAPELRNVRWKDGQVRWVQVAPQRVWPRPLRIAVNALVVVGVGCIAYLLIRAAIAIAGLV